MRDLLAIENEELCDILVDLLSTEEKRVVLYYFYECKSPVKFWRDVDRHFGWYYGRSHFFYRRAKKKWKEYLIRHKYIKE